MATENAIEGTANTSKSGSKVRYAVVGLGFIAQAAVLPAFANAKGNSELVALVSGDEKKLRTLSRKYKVAKTYSYEQYADCLESGEIDAVYIALPNHMHRAYAESALMKGIHVLCEKPMAPTEKECEAMIEAAARGKAKLMIAYRLHFEKGNLTAMDAVQSGQIGELRIFRSGFTQQVTPRNSRLRKEDQGGPLFDVGVYCINAARNLFRAEPEEVFSFEATGNDPRFKEVSEMSSATMRFPGERLAQFICSFGAADRSTYEVIGTKGVLKMDPAYGMTGDIKMELTIEGKRKKSAYKNRDQFGPELIYFSDCIINNTQPEPGGAEGLADVRIINALLASQSLGKPIKVAAVDVGERPSAEQEIHKPAFGKPELVRAMTPSQK